MPLSEAQVETEYIVREINTDDEELNSFLFTLGCYSGERISLISKRRSNFTISIKDARYNIDRHLASVIQVDVA